MRARRSPGELTKFLWNCGLWLVVVEWFVVTTAFTFAPKGVAQVGGLALIPLQDHGHRHRLPQYDEKTPSLAFLLVTLGPAAILLAYSDRVTGFARETLVMFGRAPFAFNVAHLCLIHTLAVLTGILQGFEAGQFLTIFFYFPRGYGVSLPVVYAVWLIVIAILYPRSRWVAGAKARRRDWWLSYL